jgi:hypothetical protein
MPISPPIRPRHSQTPVEIVTTVPGVQLLLTNTEAALLRDILNLLESGDYITQEKIRKLLTLFREMGGLEVPDRNLLKNLNIEARS